MTSSPIDFSALDHIAQAASAKIAAAMLLATAIAAAARLLASRHGRPELGRALFAVVFCAAAACLSYVGLALQPADERIFNPFVVALLCAAAAAGVGILALSGARGPGSVRP